MGSNRIRSKLLYSTLLVAVLCILTPLHASEQKLPVIDGEEIVAKVADDPVTMAEYNRLLSSVHSGQSEKKDDKLADRIDYKGILQRLITMRLIRLESINMGLNELPDVQELMTQYSRQTLIGLLRGLHVKDMAADEEEIERLYKEAVMEFKLNSVLFDKKEAADKVSAEIRAKGDFDEIIKRTIADGTAKGKGEGEYIKGQELLPKIMEAVNGMKAGSVSPVIELNYGYIIFRLEDTRLPETPGARDEARKQALDYKRKKALEEYKDALIKKYAKIDVKVLDGLDYESTLEDFEKLSKDTRAAAEIDGEPSITVGELTEALRKKYFHGVESAIKKKKLNDKKRSMLYDDLLQKRVLLKEALNQGMDKSPVYKSMLKENESSVLFDAFMKKVILPDIRVSAQEVQEYYDKHIDKYSSPEMMKINSIVFKKKDDAEAAMARLKKGTDLKWLSANAEGQVDKDAKGLLSFEGTIVITKDLDEALLKALSKAAPADIRLYTSPEKYYYVLYIQDVFPSRPTPFEELKDEMASAVYKDRINRSIEDWAARLREAYEVKIYIKEF